MKIKIQDDWHDVLLDTGANINVIELSLMNNQSIGQVGRKNLKVTCANGDSLNVIGKIDLTRLMMLIR